LHKLHGNHWSAEIMALNFVTAMYLQEGHLSFCFHTFTDYTLLKTIVENIALSVSISCLIP
jgi:hypothetical protein